MHFVSSRPPLNDFVVTLNIKSFDDRIVLRSLQKENLTGGKQTLFYTNTLRTHINGRVLFSGFALKDGTYITDTKGLLDVCNNDPNATNLLDARGNWVCLTHKAGITQIRCDPFGLYPVFYFVRGKICAVSNRLHLLIEILKSAGISLSRNARAALPLLCPYYFGAQLCTKETAIKDIFLLPIQKSITLTTDFRLQHDNVYESILSPSYQRDDYHDLVLAARNDICEDVSMLARNATCFMNLSGGHDSRIIYGALVRENLLDRVFLRTMPHKNADFKIVLGLSNMFGGKFLQGDLFDLGAGDLNDTINRFRSFNLGLYNLPNSLGPHSPLKSHPEVVAFGGGGGECLRAYYSNYLHLTEYDNPATVKHAIARHLRKWLRDSGIAPEYYGAVANIILEELCLSNFNSVNEALDHHYLNYRNRFHFGNKSHRFSFGNFIYHPIMQPSLLRAANLLNYREKLSAKLVFDLTASLVGLLPRLDYDTAEKNFKKDLIEKSSFSDLPINLRIRMDLSPSKYNNRVRTDAHYQPPKFSPEQKQSLLLDLFLTSYDYLNNDEILQRFLTDQFREWTLRIINTPGTNQHRYTSCFVGLHDTWRLIET